MRIRLLVPIIAVLVAIGGLSIFMAINWDSPQPTTNIPTAKSQPLASLEYSGSRGVPPDGIIVNEINKLDDTDYPEIPDIKHPNLGYALDKKVSEHQTDNSASRNNGGEDATTQPPPVPVIIHLSENVDAVVTFLQDNGGDPRNTGDDYIEAYVPISLLAKLSEQPGILRVRELIPARTR